MTCYAIAANGTEYWRAWASLCRSYFCITEYLLENCRPLGSSYELENGEIASLFSSRWRSFTDTSLVFCDLRSSPFFSSEETSECKSSFSFLGRRKAKTSTEGLVPSLLLYCIIYWKLGQHLFVVTGHLGIKLCE